MNYHLDCIITLDNGKFWEKIDDIIKFITETYDVINIEDATNDNKINLIIPETKLKKIYRIIFISNQQEMELALYNGYIRISGLFGEAIIFVINFRKIISDDLELLFFDTDYNYSLEITNETTFSDIIEVFPS